MKASKYIRGQKKWFYRVCKGDTKKSERFK